MSTNTIRSGWYVVASEGSGWTALKVSRDGELTGMVEECMANTHLVARDRWAAIVNAINHFSTEQVDPQTAKIVLAAWNEDALPEKCFVERILLDV